MENKEENKTARTQSNQVGTGDHWDTIAKVGRFQDSGGKWHNFTEEEFDEIIKNFKPGEVPVVLGHPKTNSPAYGWVKALRRAGDLLQAEYQDLTREMLELLAQKAYKFKSISLDTNSNELLHVGFLGAANPAIPGLGPIKFSQQEFSAFDFSNGALDTPVSGQDKGEKTMDIQELMAQIEALKKELADIKAKYEALAQEKEQVEENFSRFQNEVQVDKRKARAAALVNSGRLTPGEAEDALTFAAAMAESPLKFAKGGQDISVEEHYWRSLENRQVNDLFGSFSAPTKEALAQVTIDPNKL